MLRSVTPVSFGRGTTNGRTRPSMIICEHGDGSDVDVIAKFSSGCDERESSLAREVIAACLAGDLGLPVPEPLLVEVPPHWPATVTDPVLRAQIQASSPVAFGSTKIDAPYVAWNSGTWISEAMLPVCAAIFVFDALLQNVDRRVENPNCLVLGPALRIIDHELSLSFTKFLGWRAPWVDGGLSSLEFPGMHIFRSGLRGRMIDFDPIRQAWLSVTELSIQNYGSAVPASWMPAASAAVDEALQLIRNVRDHIDGCLTEVGRVLR